MVDTTNERTKVFISYSHKDAKWLNRLRVHLKPLERRYGVNVWADTDIKPGSKWREEIEKALASAKVAVLLISADFIASDFVAENELPPLLRAAQSEGTIILPLILSPSMFIRVDELSQFQTVNDPSKPLVSLMKSEQEAVLVRLTEAIENALGYSPENKDSKGGVATHITKPQHPQEGPTEGDAGRMGMKEQRARLKISPGIWVGLITGLVTIVAIYWYFVYKPSRSTLGQEAHYTGRVVDERTNKPIHNAKVSIEQDQNVPQIQHTDSEGIFHVITQESTNAARIRVEADGYKLFDRNVSFSRTGVEPVSLAPALPTPTTIPISSPTPPSRQASQPTPSPIRRPQRPSKRCTAEDMLFDKCKG